ncbi:hypothetical protein SAMN05216421_0170 [Halopseudomonas xinjiangensis]|uniref:Uncharacterized protein n=1 Tax=Halopseudomonas xinjiangensis TaxID=487184 RepID=A0A1H1LGR5_9GAMM|nr:hypothetical protein [Halopseudomonas xinjiangensis]SDR73512.1 hypothetical protein SAMN05216421_0170 [Halopseudomonas xinjiangensis]
MLKLTTLKHCGWGLVALAVVGAFSGGADVETSDALSDSPAGSLSGVGAVVRDVQAREEASGCRDPHRTREPNNSVTTQVISMACATEDRDLLALDRPGLTLQPLVEPGPGPRTEQPPQSIAF